MIKLKIHHHWRDSGNNIHKTLWGALRGQRCSHPFCTKHVRSGYTVCEEHLEESRRKRWESLPIAKYVGQIVYSRALDRYFLHEEDLADYLDESGTDIPLQMVECDPDRLTCFEWADMLHDMLADEVAYEDVLPDHILKLMSGLNDELARVRPILSWHPGKRRILDEDLPLFYKESRFPAEIRT